MLVNQSEPEQRYSPVAQALHWLIVLLLIVQYSTEFILPYVLPKSADDAIAAWHFSIGPTILLVMLLRLTWRLTHAVPEAPSDPPLAFRLLSRATHWLFYAIMIVIPLLGWISASADGTKVYLAGVVLLPIIVAKNKSIADSVGGIHGTLALVLIGLIILHVAGVLYHVMIKRDHIVQRMLPGSPRRLDDTVR